MQTPSLVRISIIILLLFGFFLARHYFQPATAVLAPQGTEIYATIHPIDISWTPGTPGIDQIELLPAGGGSPMMIYSTKSFAYPVPDTSGYFKYVPSSPTPVGSYYVRIHTITNEYVQSSKAFRVVAQEQFEAIMHPPIVAPTITAITILSPNGGEKFKAGSSIAVTWKSQGIAPNEILNVDLLKGPMTGLHFYGNSHSPNDGNEMLEIPVFAPAGSDYYVRVNCDINPRCGTDNSDAPFTVIVLAGASSAPEISTPPSSPLAPMPAPLRSPAPSSKKKITPIVTPTPTPSPAVMENESYATSTEGTPAPEVSPTKEPPPIPEKQGFLQILFEKFLSLFR